MTDREFEDLKKWADKMVAKNREREKLIDLLSTAGWNLFTDGSAKGEIADHLIANGVTISKMEKVAIDNNVGDKMTPTEPLTNCQQWIPVSERLPEEEGLYLVAVVNDHERRYSKTAWYHGHGNWFLHQKVTHWSYLPQPPKGE